MLHYKIIITAFVLVFTAIMPTNVSAQESCGQPADVYSIGDAERYCNIYERQFEYRKKRNEFRNNMNERREDYIAPYLSVKEKYAKDMEALNNQRNHDNDVVSR